MTTEASVRSRSLFARYVRAMSECEFVELWNADLDAVPDRLADLLCDEERARALRLADRALRRRWTASRALLRLLLGERLGAEPESLRFELGAHGKPCLAGAQERFNLSHAGPLALYAFCSSRDVGVDVELLSRSCKRRDEIAIARRLFGAEAAGRLSALHGSERSSAFLKEWVKHEASVKCLGSGIGHALAKPPDSAVWVCELNIDGAEAALAVAGGKVDVRMHAWALEPAVEGISAE